MNLNNIFQKYLNMSNNIKILLSFVIITIVTAWFNYHIVLTQDTGDNQIWHISQLLQWIAIYLSIAWISKKYLIIIGCALTYPFIYDGLLNSFLGKEWFYGGVEGYGKDYTIDYRVKIILFAVGILVIFLNQYLSANKKPK